MPVFFQQQINEYTRLGIWKIEENEAFFKDHVPQHRDVTHPHKRLQHLAGRFLLRFLYPDFPYELIQIADTRKPFLPDEQYHFSISHCGDFAAAIVSSKNRVGVDIEIPASRVLKITHKFLTKEEIQMLNVQYSMINVHLPQPQTLNVEPETLNAELGTLLWSAKEAVFKWYGEGAVDFKEHIQLKKINTDPNFIESVFVKNNLGLKIYFSLFDAITLTWVIS